MLKYLAGAALLIGGVALVAVVSVCGCIPESASAPQIRFHIPDGGSKHVVDVAGLDGGTLAQLRSAQLTPEQWSEVLRVSLGAGAPPMIGDYAVEDDVVRFTPMFGLDAGREYHAIFTAAAVPGQNGATTAPLNARFTLPAVNVAPSTVVSHVFPSADLVPENQLRLYVHFSAPMGRKGGLEYIKLLDADGREVVDPFLPLDAEFWNDDHTRYTVFFDPGRQKRGILPNQQMGRSLEPGKRYTLVVSRQWRDGNGLPLKEDFSREFTVGPADEQPLDAKAWTIGTPGAGTREPLVVIFPEALDHGLLLRALGVTGADNKFLGGEIVVEARETRWRFTPQMPWQIGRYQLVALPMLEDLAGNRIGRAFEVDRFDRSDSPNDSSRTSIPFTVSAR